jgi:hypothetical protein
MGATNIDDEAAPKPSISLLALIGKIVIVLLFSGTLLCYLGSMRGLRVEGSTWRVWLRAGVVELRIDQSSVSGVPVNCVTGYRYETMYIRVGEFACIELDRGFCFQQDWAFGTERWGFQRIIRFPIPLVLVLILPLMFIPTKRRLALKRRHARRQCLNCGYQLIPSQTRCSECGQAFGSETDQE